MPALEVNLTNCDRELIRVPGHIQSNGFLIVTDGDDVIRYFSENIYDLVPGFPLSPEGMKLSGIEAYLNDTRPDFLTQLLKFGRENESFEQINPYTISIGGIMFYVIISLSAELYLLEFEPVYNEGAIDMQRMIGRSLSQMLADKQLQTMLDHSAAQVKKIIEYDRVMVYRFAEDGHGEVIAEAKNDDLEPWLGLHYPASDIPKQARELYKLNLTRIISDVYAPPASIFPVIEVTENNIDLTNAQLRAVSPIHIQYLKNMGVASSFSVSLIYRGELWGLIACHNYTRQFIDYRCRESAKLIGQVLSSALEFRQDERNQHDHELLSHNVDVITKQLQQNNSLEKALTGEEINLLNITFAEGVILKYEKKLTRRGVTPDDKQLEGLLKWIKAAVYESMFFTTELSSVYPGAAAFQDIGSGIMLMVLSRELEEYIIWFKPQLEKTIAWAGNPDKSLNRSADGLLNISPRHSFKTFLETVSGKSTAWSNEEVNAVIRLKEEITFAVNAKADSVRVLNEQLRQAYEELDTFSYTISHDLKNPISAIKLYVQLMIADPVARIDNIDLVYKIDERANKMNFMINSIFEYSRIGRQGLNIEKLDMKRMINEVIDDQLLQNKTITITVGDTPDLFGDPVMMLQVFSNLVGNAIKYSGHDRPGTVHIEGTLKDDRVFYYIKDNGIGISIRDLSEVFVLFNRMDNAKSIEGTGVGLAIVKRIVEKHKGTIHAESELGKGSRFILSFHRTPSIA